MNLRIKVIDEELTAPPHNLENLQGYIFIRILVRLHGTPVGWIQLPVVDGQCPAAGIRKKILDVHSKQIASILIQNTLASALSNNMDDPPDILNFSKPKSSGIFPLVTVAVCTRNRTADLEKCLYSLAGLDYPNLDLLVIDNAPSSEDTARLVRESFPEIRYVRENRPGLDWARNRAAKEARGDIIAYTDDDVIVDGKWIDRKSVV